MKDPIPSSRLRFLDQTSLNQFVDIVFHDFGSLCKCCNRHTELCGDNRNELVLFIDSKIAEIQTDHITDDVDFHNAISVYRNK